MVMMILPARQLADRNIKRPISGAGVGLRSCHYDYILREKPNIPWFEAISDNYLIDGGPSLQYLDAIRAHYPMALHGVGLSLGSTDPLNTSYLKKLKALVDHIQPGIVSDHLCWTSVHGHYFHDLLPLPYTETTVKHVSERIARVQDYLGRQILIENVSSYLQYKQSDMTEWEFVSAIANAADCFILFDVNNIYVSSQNHQFDALEYLDGISPESVKQFHLAGYTDKGGYLFDSHSAPVHDPVWALYEKALQRFGAQPTLIEWDDDIPPFSVLEVEAAKADAYQEALYEIVE